MPVSFVATTPSRWLDCTPSDATDLTGSVGLYVGGTGNVAVRTLNADTTTVTFNAVPVGTFIPGNFSRVMAATTATLILVAYA
jgi:hypothetical protein